MLLLALAGIAFFSHEKGAQSSAHSRAATEAAVTAWEKIRGETFSPIRRRVYLQKLEPHVRELAHVFLFFLTAFLLTVAAVPPGYPREKARPWILSAVFLLALGDEIHQLYSPGRHFAFKDVTLDWFGGYLGMTAAFALFLRDGKAHHAPKEKK